MQFTNKYPEHEAEINHLKKENKSLKTEKKNLLKQIDKLENKVLIAVSVGRKVFEKRVRQTKKSDETSTKDEKSNPGIIKQQLENAKRCIDETIEIDNKVCKCGNCLSSIVDTYTRYVEDIKFRKITKKIIVNRRYCTHCEKTITPDVPDALPNQRFGVNIMGLTFLLKQWGHLMLKYPNLQIKYAVSKYQNQHSTNIYFKLQKKQSLYTGRYMMMS